MEEDLYAADLPDTEMSIEVDSMIGDILSNLSDELVNMKEEIRIMIERAYAEGYNNGFNDSIETYNKGKVL